MPKAVFSREAEKDLLSIFEYTLQIYGPAKAEEYYASILQGVKTASVFPELGQVYETLSGERYRKYNIGRHALFYLTENTDIFVVRVLHLSQDFDRLLR